jgi:hypothetical protein
VDAIALASVLTSATVGLTGAGVALCSAHRDRQDGTEAELSSEPPTVTFRCSTPSSARATLGSNDLTISIRDGVIGPDHVRAELVELVATPRRNGTRPSRSR